MNTYNQTLTKIFVVTYTAQAFQASIHGLLSIHKTHIGAFRRMSKTAQDLIELGQFFEMEKIENHIKIVRKSDNSIIELYVEERTLEV